MTWYPASIFAISAFTASVLLASPTLAAEDIRASVLEGKILQPDAVTRRDARCDKGYLVGVGLNYTDRVVGYWYRCASMLPDGRWNTEEIITTPGSGQVRQGQTRWHDCPRDYYIVGLGGTFGTYGYDSAGMAQPVPQEMLADVQPLCRLSAAIPAVYPTPRAYFEGGDDNRLRDLPARVPDDARACARGSVATGLRFSVNFKRSANPQSQFYDVALICDRVITVIDRGLADRPNP